MDMKMKNGNYTNYTLKIYGNAISKLYPGEWVIIDEFKKIVNGNGYQFMVVIYVLIKNFVTDLKAGKIRVERDIYGKIEIVPKD
jgi:hypothetical protein